METITKAAYNQTSLLHKGKSLLILEI